MGGIKSKGPNKYVLLYGPKGVGKSYMLYSSQARFNNVLSKLEATEGLNFEEIEISGGKVTLGVFDVSGDIIQYDIINIICKSVEISGLIFMIPVEKLDMYDVYKEQLSLILNNKYLETDNLNLLVLYNLKAELKGKLGWIDENVLDTKIRLKKIFDGLVSNGKYLSRIVDVNNSLVNENTLKEILREFMDNFD